MKGHFEVFTQDNNEPFELRDNAEFISASGYGIGNMVQVVVFHHDKEGE